MDGRVESELPHQSINYGMLPPSRNYVVLGDCAPKTASGRTARYRKLRKRLRKTMNHNTDLQVHIYGPLNHKYGGEVSFYRYEKETNTYRLLEGEERNRQIHKDIFQQTRVR